MGIRKTFVCLLMLLVLKSPYALGENTYDPFHSGTHEINHLTSVKYTDPDARGKPPEQLWLELPESFKTKMKATYESLENILEGEKNNLRPFSTEETHLLKNLKEDASRFSKSGGGLNLIEWNLWHYRLVALRSSVLKKEQEPSLNHLTTQEDAKEYIVEARADSPLKLLIHSSQSRENAHDNRHVVATTAELGIVPLNRSFAKGTYPLGVTLHPIDADGTTFDPLNFLLHDLQHAAAASKLDKDAEFLEWVENNIHDPNLSTFHFMFFNVHHESGLTVDICASDDKIGERRPQDGFGSIPILRSQVFNLIVRRLMDPKDMQNLIPERLQRFRWSPKYKKSVAIHVDQAWKTYCAINGKYDNRNKNISKQFPPYISDLRSKVHQEKGAGSVQNQGTSVAPVH